MRLDAPPAAPGFAQFRLRVQDDPQLQQRLRHVDDRAAFVAAVVALGAQHGFIFSTADVAAAIQQAQIAWLMHWQPVI